jgi:hypothetical protein
MPVWYQNVPVLGAAFCCVQKPRDGKEGREKKECGRRAREAMDLGEREFGSRVTWLTLLSSAVRGGICFVIGWLVIAGRDFGFEEKPLPSVAGSIYGLPPVPQD